MNQSANLAIAKRGEVTSDPFSAANQRVEQQLSSTGVKLSSFSQIKSGFANVQSASKDLADPKKTGTADDIVKAAQSFAAAYNGTSSAVKVALSGDGKQAGALEGDVRVRIAAGDLQSIVTNGSNVADLKEIGINVKSDGSISVDATALKNAIQSDAAAVKSTLSKIGQQADQVSAKELSSTGNVGRSVDTLSNLSKNLENQLAVQKNLATASQATVDQQVAGFSGSATSGAAAYLKMFSL